ncbi:MAG: DegT/DnrJ/EryC1/StrS family aminotransferase [Patescibacteria group bacterium]
MDKLAILGGPKTIDPSRASFPWPVITPEVEKAVLNQLRTCVSIYDRSGIFAEFEKKYADYYGLNHSLLSSSGTTAIFSMFEGINLQPGDEVICPTYTFFASASPLMYLGAIPVFCDCNPDGNINPEEIAKKITDRSKAVVITHMWGMPCEMDPIIDICRKKGLLLLEDASHAHGATYKGKKAGTFGDASAWSLQGQKIITGGEGGIMLTNNPEIFYRALLQGHYNKRCQQQIPADHPLCEFALTGFGLKLRAHPLAIAIANEQFSHLDQWIGQKQEYVSYWEKEFGKYEFLKMPDYPNRQPSWYAFVMQFDKSRSNGVSIAQFVRALHAEGLVEVDRPGSTRPIHDLPLFIKPNLALPKLYSNPLTHPGPFANALLFYENAIKLPVWTFPEDEPIVRKYAEGFHKVCRAVQNEPELLRGLQ